MPSSVKHKSANYSTLLLTERTSLKSQSSSSHEINQTLNLTVKKQIDDKFKTFCNWNYREVIKKGKKQQPKQQSLTQRKLVSRDNNQLIKALLNFTKTQQQQQSQKSKPIIDELIGVKAQRRQRFKKSQNPLHFIKHYMQKQNFKPSTQQMFLIQKTIQLKKFIENGSMDTIEKVLKKIYILMNMAVDCNQLRFLILLILLAGDICYRVKDHNRAFYFYNQARLASTYANILYIKTQALMGMGLVAIDIGMWDEAIIILKKNLQYSWQSKNIQTQLMIYDIMGSCYYSQGKMKQAQYYHTRYIQSETENTDSAIKRISVEMINDYNKKINSMQRDNLTSLFIQYLNLPITNFQKVPIPNTIKKTYPNYKDGESPRKQRSIKKFQLKDFPTVQKQIQQVIAEDYEFVTEIPTPDMHRNYVAVPRFGRRRKEQQFQQSSVFHRIIGTKPPKLNFDGIYKYPLQKRIQRALSQRKNENWWQDMLVNTRKQRTQKVGSLKQKVRLSHLSYHKYPDQRKRSQSIKNQKIKESFNKTLLDWIDPIK